jgi:hypothetical protein
MDNKDDNRDSSGKFVEGNKYRIKKGEVLNPDGAPKGKRVSTYLKELLETELVNGKTIAEILADTIVLEAKKGNFQFMRELLDRTEGKVMEQISAELEGGINIVFKRSDENC